MYARLTIGQVPPERLPEAIAIFRDGIVSAMKQQPGNQGGRLLTNRTNGHFVSVSVWETESDLEAGLASGYVQAQVEKWIDLMVEPPAIEQYELVIRRTQPRGSFVRLTTLQIRPEEWDHALEIIHNVAEIVARQPGSHGLSLMTDAKRGVARIFTVWETESDMIAGESNGFYEEQRARVAGLLAEPPGPGEYFEVSVSVIR